jgi:hypothetical protein
LSAIACLRFSDAMANAVLLSSATLCFALSRSSWSEVYHMPVYLRRFYFNKLIDLKKKEAEEMKKAQSKSKVRMR